ncbi:MAG: hypothetical protein ACTSW1_00590 [Candidatus Hodarchaeales archaeon]
MDPKQQKGIRFSTIWSDFEEKYGPIGHHTKPAVYTKLKRMESFGWVSRESMGEIEKGKTITGTVIKVIKPRKEIVNGSFWRLTKNSLNLYDNFGVFAPPHTIKRKLIEYGYLKEGFETGKIERGISPARIEFNPEKDIKIPKDLAMALLNERKRFLAEHQAEGFFSEYLPKLNRHYEELSRKVGV